MDSRAQTGRRGEEAAARTYQRLGFRVVERNYRCGAGEIDIIATRGSLLVFCEVKSRRSERFGVPAEAVGYAKQQRLRRLAALWLADRRPGYVDIRFDVASVRFRGDRIDVELIPDAF
jgi:putative endonuclease